MRGDGRPRWPALLVGAIALAYLTVVLVGPVAALLVETARLPASELLSALGTDAARAALTNTAMLVAIAVIVNVVVGPTLALLLVRDRVPGRALLAALVDLPLAVSPVVVGLAFFLIVGRTGWLGPTLSSLGIKVLFSFPGLVVATLFVTLPYVVDEVAHVLEELGTSEEEAAATMGANDWQTFFWVTLPNIRRALGYGLLMTVARALGEFGAVLVLGGSITGVTQTATTFIHDAIEERALASAYTMAWLLAVVSSGLLLTVELARAARGHRS